MRTVDELCRDADQRDAQADPLDALRDAFAPGAPGTIYLDSNSIGPMPRAAPRRMAGLLEDGWRVARREGWNLRGPSGHWLEQPRLLGAALARVLGAHADDVLVCDSTSINHFKLLCHGLAASGRNVIVIERDVFPTNRYAAQGAAERTGAQLRTIAGIEDLDDALAAGDVGVVSLSHVDYRSSRRLDMAGVSARIRARGALSLWDLSHSAGAVDVALRANGADMAVGSGYKYLCGGPGAPSFLYLHPRWRDAASPVLRGWMGHADAFAFHPDYEPAPGIARFLSGTPAVLANSAFAAAAELWRQVDPAALDARHRALTDWLIEALDEQCSELGIEVASPRAHRERGGHVSLRFAAAAALARAMIAEGVILSARQPDALRLAVHPLTTRYAELARAVAAMRRILSDGSWRDPRFAADAN